MLDWDRTFETVAVPPVAPEKENGVICIPGNIKTFVLKTRLLATAYLDRPNTLLVFEYLPESSVVEYIFPAGIEVVSGRVTENELDVGVVRMMKVEEPSLDQPLGFVQ
jgi:hypothetical protein